MKSILFALILMFAQQVEPILSSEIIINDKISKERTNEIISVVHTTINKYYDAGKCWDEYRGQFDEERYLEFISLFAGSATVVDDLSFSKETIHFSDYASVIFNKLQENGVPFKLEKVQINRIDIDETGFYIIDLTVKKRLYSGVNENGNPIILKRGRRIELNMRIDLPDYLITDARIQYIELHELNRMKKMIEKPAAYISKMLKKDKL